MAAAPDPPVPAAFQVDYTDAPLPTGLAETDAFVHEWGGAYQEAIGAPADLRILEADGFAYLFDDPTEAGKVAPEAAGRWPRVVAAWGFSRAPGGPRDRSRMAGHPAPPPGDDRGHLLAHASGGGADVNLVPMARELNRGWSPEGRTFRAMERHCAENPGTFCFVRPLYADGSDRPAILEVGVARAGRLWVETFRNARPAEPA